MDNSGPAFPTSSSRDGPFGGLTKREYFAAHCPEDELNQLCSHTRLAARLGKEVYKITVTEFLEARCAARYEWADAMIKEASNEPNR
jgi:hypothetical protein